MTFLSGLMITRKKPSNQNLNLSVGSCVQPIFCHHMLRHLRWNYPLAISSFSFVCKRLLICCKTYFVLTEENVKLHMLQSFTSQIWHYFQYLRQTCLASIFVGFVCLILSFVASLFCIKSILNGKNKIWKLQKYP